MRLLRQSISLSVAVSLFSIFPAFADSRPLVSFSSLPSSGISDACGLAENYWRMDGAPFAAPTAPLLENSSCGWQHFAHGADHWYRQPTPAPAANSDTPLSVAEELQALGSDGAPVARARDAALAILAENNSCSTWFQQKEQDPAAVLRAIHFRVEQDGPKYTLRKTAKDGTSFYQQPYAAKVLQHAAPPVWITLNSSGAFFRSSSGMRYLYEDGTPAGIVSTQRLHIEIYSGDSLPAQVLILLHELAHVVDAIPADYGPDASVGLSSQNTELVLHYCRAQVESAGKRR